MKERVEDFRTPLARVIGLGSSHKGTRHFWLQRVTAIINLPLCFLFVFFIAAFIGKGFFILHYLLLFPQISFVLVFMLLSSFYHMKLGLQSLPIPDASPQCISAGQSLEELHRTVSG